MRSIGYQGAHDALRRRRGKAAGQVCADCGGEAQWWAYNRSGIGEVVGLNHDDVCVYSTDPMQYDPCCKSCARRRDQPPPKTHCKRGHEFTPENTRHSSRGRRVCRTCHRDYQRQWREGRR